MAARSNVGTGILLFAFLGLGVVTARAACEIVENGKRTPFTGGSIDRLLIEKRSLTILNAEFPALNVIERTFKGDLQTCTICTEKYVTCIRSLKPR